MSRHLATLNEEIVRTANTWNGRLLVMMPPRHGKSELVSHYTPAWYLGNNPHHQIILASYEMEFATGWGLKARDTFAQMAPDLWGINRLGRDAASHWTPAGYAGGMVCSGARGAISGKGGNLLIIDDPIKNEIEASSPTYRNRNWDWWQTTFSTRAEPGASIIIVMTRWHMDDLIGRLLVEMKAGGEQWRILRLCALHDPRISAGSITDWREEGEALWPWRWPKDELERIKRNRGGYTWNALYQQVPAPPEGNVVLRTWWQYWTELPEGIDEWIQSWDMTFKDATGSSFVVGQLWARKGANKFLIDQIRERLTFTATLGALRGFTKRHPQTGAILIEDKANGPAVMDTLQDEISGIIPVEPHGGKIARANAASPAIESGNVYLPNYKTMPGKEWVEDFIDEWSFVPHGEFWDQVDASSQALKYLKEAERELVV